MTMTRNMPLAFFLFFLGCALSPNHATVRTYADLSRRFEETLKYTPLFSSGHSMRLEISGTVNGKGIFIYSSPHGSNAIERNGTQITLEGESDETIAHDWYDPEIFITFIPENEHVRGEITVRYRVY